MRDLSFHLRSEMHELSPHKSCTSRKQSPASSSLRQRSGTCVPAFLVLCLSLCSPNAGAAQSSPTPSPGDTTHHAPDTDSVSAPRIERFIDLDDAGDRDGERTTERVAELRARPIDINAASARELSVIPSLSLIDAGRIVRYRSTEGYFTTLRDLVQVDGISESDYRALRPFVTLGPASGSTGLSGSISGTGNRPARATSWRDALNDPDVRMSYRWSRDIDLGEGYSSDTSKTRYLGGPVRHVVRADARFGRRLRVAGALDQDPGEAWTWNPAAKRPGFDHVAGTVAVQHVGPVDRLVVGDFTVSSGHGVGLWRGLAFGKGRNPTIGVIRSGRGISPFASTEENRFFRGGAASVHLTDLLGYAVPGARRGPLRVTGYGFFSRRRLDASWDVDPATGERRISTLQTAGLHRTVSETTRRDAVRESVIGGGLDAEAQIGSVSASAGLASFSSHLDAPLKPAMRPDEAFDRTTSALAVYSTYLTLQWHDLLVTGEGARLTTGPREDGSARYAGVLAVAYDDGHRVDAVLHLRSFGRGYDNPYVAAFNETAAQNEQGIYGGIRLSLHRTFHVSGYIDQYAFKWLRFNVSRPTVGRDARLVVEYDPRRWLSHLVELRSETKEQRGNPTALVGGRLRSPTRAEPVIPSTRQSLRVDTDLSVSRSFELATELQASRVVEKSPHLGSPDIGSAHISSAPRYGWLMVQRMRWQIHPRISLTGSIALFDTDDFSTRMYTYERDVRYAFSVPALFGRGERSYALLKIKLPGSLMVEAKYSVTRYDDRNQVRSGINQLSSNRIRALGIQLHWRL